MPDLQVEMYRRNIEDIKLLPKAAWTFVEKDTNGMFPIPNDMPYEDIWFSFIIYTKKGSDSKYKALICMIIVNTTVKHLEIFQIILKNV